MGWTPAHLAENHVLVVVVKTDRLHGCTVNAGARLPSRPKSWSPPLEMAMMLAKSGGTLVGAGVPFSLPQDTTVPSVRKAVAWVLEAEMATTLLRFCGTG